MENKKTGPFKIVSKLISLHFSFFQNNKRNDQCPFYSSCLSIIWYSVW